MEYSLVSHISITKSPMTKPFSNKCKTGHCLKFHFHRKVGVCGVFTHISPAEVRIGLNFDLRYPKLIRNSTAPEFFDYINLCVLCTKKSTGVVNGLDAI